MSEEAENAMAEAYRLNQPATGEAAQSLEEFLKEHNLPMREFKPGAWYNEAGNFVEILLADASFYARWLNPQITTLHSMKTNEVIGVQVYGADSLVECDLRQKLAECERERDSWKRIASV